MKFFQKMCLRIILKVIKNQGFTRSSEDTFFEKPQGERSQIDPPAVLRLMEIFFVETEWEEDIKQAIDKWMSYKAMLYKRTGKTLCGYLLQLF